jgi:hypothetical protein
MSVPKEITDLIAGSGNTFHAAVARWFKKNGWHVVVSPYYLDQSQGKAREIDLIAEKLWPTNYPFGGSKGDVAVRLFIECKFIATDAVFWFVDKDKEAAKALVCATHLFRPSNAYTSEHHYLSQSEKVAKIFASAGGKASENEPFYKALNQSLNALVSMRGRPLMIKDQRKRPVTPVAVLECPVVVCSSFERLYGVDFLNESSPVRISDNFQLEVQYAYVDANGTSRDDYFLLDFVERHRLEEFCKTVDASASAAVQLASD